MKSGSIATVSRTLLRVMIAGLLVAIPLKSSVASSAYSHGTLTCLQGTAGPGVRLILTQTKTCEESSSYPRLEIDIKVQPVPLHKTIAIGSENGAFRCTESRQSCQQFISGEIVFEHFLSKPKKKNEMSTTDGHYVLRLRTRTERGYFKVDCAGICW